MSQSVQDRAVEAGRGALFIGFAKVFFMVAGFLQRWLLTKLMTPAEYGIFALVNGTVSTVNNTVVQGTIQSVSKFTAEDETRADAVKAAALRMQAFLGTGMGLGFFLAAPLLARLFHAPDHARWFRMAAVIPFLYGFYTVFVGSANGLRRFRTQARFDISFSVAKTVLMLGGALALRGVGGTVTGAFAGFAAAAVVILLVAMRVMGLPRREAIAAGPPFAVSKLVVFMGGVGLYTLLVNLALNYDLWILRRFAGASAPGPLADTVAGQYEALRNLALLPYQGLLVVTFVIFPLISRSTFDQDREATRAYVRGTLRVALLLAVAMGVVLGARPQAILSMLYKPEYLAGAQALPVLVAGICCLALLAVACAIINAAGRPRVAVALVAITVSVGAASSWLLVRAQPVGPQMLFGMAVSTSLGMAAGFIAAVAYLAVRFGAALPVLTLLRVLGASAAAVLATHFLPGHGVVLGAATIIVAAGVYLTALVLLREFGPEDRAKLKKILKR